MKQKIRANEAKRVGQTLFRAGCIPNPLDGEEEDDNVSMELDEEYTEEDMENVDDVYHVDDGADLVAPATPATDPVPDYPGEYDEEGDVEYEVNKQKYALSKANEKKDYLKPI